MEIKNYVKENMDFIKKIGILSDNSEEKRIQITLPFSTTDTYSFVEKNGSVLENNKKQNAEAERCQRINNKIIEKIMNEIDKEYNNKNGEYFEFHFDEKTRLLTITDLKFYREV